MHRSPGNPPNNPDPEKAHLQEEAARQAEALFAEYTGYAAERQDSALVEHLLSDQPPQVVEEFRGILKVYESVQSFFPRPGQALGPGQLIGDYRLIKRLGHGGMGEVWHAEQLSLMSRPVALKVLHPEACQEPTSIYRFRREAEAASRISHPGVATVYAADEWHGIHFIAQELVEGGHSLADRLDRVRRIPERDRDYFLQVSNWMYQTARALQAAHEEGVVHRDLKPANLLLTPEDQVKLIDFGLAKVSGASALTKAGTFAGTFGYMSPEQANRGANIDYRSDIFSFGSTFYEALTLNHPFPGDNLQQVCQQIRFETPPDPRHYSSRLPRDLAIVIGKAMEKNPERRYETMAALADDLERFLQHRPILAQPPRPWALACQWVRRRPVLSATGAVAVIALTCISFLSYHLWHRGQALDSNLQVSQTQERGLSMAIRHFEYFLHRLWNPMAGDGHPPLDVAILEGWKEAQRQLPTMAKAERAYLARIFGESLLELGMVEESQAALRISLFAMQDLSGPTSSPTLEVHLRYIRALYRGGNYGLAEKELDWVRNTLSETRPRKSPLCAEADLIYGHLLRETHRDKEALKVLDRTLKLVESLDPVPVWHLNQTRIAMAMVYMNMGKFDQARELLELPLAGVEGDQISDHPVAMNALFVLSQLNMMEGKFEEAEKAFRYLTEQRGRILSEHNTQTWNARFGLASAKLELGDYQQAHALFKDIVEFRQQRAEEHPGDYLEALVGLARTETYLGLMHLAIPRLQAAVQGWREHYGDQHLRTLEARLALAVALHLNQQSEVASREFSGVLASIDKDDRHHQKLALDCQWGLARCLVKLKRPMEALAYYRMALDGRHKEFGHIDLQTVALTHEYAHFLCDVGKESQAHDLWCDYFRILVNSYGPNHGKVRDFQESLAKAFMVRLRSGSELFPRLEAIKAEYLKSNSADLNFAAPHPSLNSASIQAEPASAKRD
ncbi:MAG: hypothetical protein DWQ01_10765 [Planctomycetota bacterium]|nr:MAG: hypothetical protein DWQ01_10765 [Planctomycetota bacterium]